MVEFLQWLSSGSIVATLFIGIILVLVTSLLLIYGVAFIQGREISFWPPKIGEKPADRNKSNAGVKKVLAKEKTKHDRVKSNPVKIKDIVLTPPAEKDCETLKVSTGEVKQFIAGEAENHPQIFGVLFSSLPLTFLRFVLLLSWNGEIATVERVLHREQAYPLNDAWTACLSLYRQATILPYRTAAPGVVVLSTSDSKRTLQLYRKLVRLIDEYLKLAEDNNMEHNVDTGGLKALLDEGEFALANNQIPLSVTRFETLLSTVHKILLNYAPQAGVNHKEAIGSTPAIRPMQGNMPSVLIVDDIDDWCTILKTILTDEGFQVQTVSSGVDAMRAMVEHDYDVVITDLRLSDADQYNQDGREVAITARKSNPKTKVMILTGYYVMASKTDILPCDKLFQKSDFDMSELIKTLMEFTDTNKSG
jgi:CheY-like chemotaxis protein